MLDCGGDDASTASESELTTDAFGNTITKQEAAQKDEEAAVRAAAKARREAKAARSAPEPAAAPAGRPQWLIDYDKVKAKAAAGGRLSGKEKKLLKRGEAREAEEAELGLTGEDADAAPLDARLAGFSLTLPGGGAAADDRGVDVVVKGFSISAPEKPLLVNADLTLSRGRRYGLIGANGRGKSTLLRFLAARRLPVPASLDILLVEQEVAASGGRVLDEVLAADETRAALLDEEATLFAALEAESGDVAAAAARLAAVADELEATDADGAEARARRILCGLGFTERMVEGPVKELSGGWRMRVSLARALLAAPRLLLLDEPTNHLDLDAVLWLDGYLTSSFPATSTLLTVSHDRDFLDETCTDLDFALQQKALKEERAKHPALKADKLEARLMERLGLPRLAEKPREYAVDFTIEAPENCRSLPGLAAELRRVGFAYEATTKSGAFRGFEDLDLCVTPSTRAALVGANGSGKSTLLKLLTGALAPTSGDASVGRNLVVGYYDQHFSELKKCGSGDSAVDFLLKTYPSLGAAQDARKWLGKFGLDSARHVMPVKDLSGGQKARVCFASIALKRPHVLILDEPTNHLDLESVDALIRALEAYEGGVLAVSHRAAKESEIPNFKGSYLGRFPLVSADFWTSDHFSERSRSVDAFSGTRARGTLMLNRR
ncbi:hypothetical protein AURANDRAFT_52644 [Aureococcus anophagefferens]|uniref:ABC transporter domain-containing protein n=1 Tax=Aureococcus anophagefferens TaxID=44056 RepID=F0Y2A6_AURAN|nr:hypothetical protein AURANDRAFT_52644 [Aureococcus anophagefferens]EGB11106.1 hypothetical protein AURANDRAFT_52644 [Aureococcus anophagefferens]|eukprot:XP_009034656.1 hypothetical protein AURANDRAFT_52644 [Aureococcus anophagefferens]